ncbi:MAG: hypothetical protein JWM37_738 [Candidatus Saccharibacteria bacterium]|nr:hypothetical protein [Candidatus Saccharibacteria bacterium]
MLCVLSTGILNLDLGGRATAALDAGKSQYLISIGPVTGSATAAYTYASFYNPVNSGKTLVAKHIRFGSDAIAAATYQDLVLSRVSTAAGGTQIAAANIPKKNADSINSVAEVRYAGVSATVTGTADSRLMAEVAAGAAGSTKDSRDYTFTGQQLVLQPGEGISLSQTAAGSTNQRIRLSVEWEETNVTPAAGNDYMLAFPRVSNAAATNYVYQSLYNPVGSGRTATISRLSIDVDCNAAAVYTNQVYIRRTTAASAGTQIASANIPERHSGAANSVMETRYQGVTVTLAGTTNSAIEQVSPCGAANEPQGHVENTYGGTSESIVLQPGEGIALISSAAGSTGQLVRMSAVWSEQASAPTAQGDYSFSAGPITGTATSGYGYVSFFNPAASGKTAVIHRLNMSADTIAAGVAVALSIERTTAASAGTQVPATDVPKNHSSTATSIMDIRTANPTVTKVGTAAARLATVDTPAAVGQLNGRYFRDFGSDGPLVLQPGEGIVLYQEAAGSTNFKIKLSLEWAEQVAVPATTNEYMLSAGPIAGTATSGYAYVALMNPTGSGKTMVFTRFGVDQNSTAAGVYVPMTAQRISAASAGTLLAATDMPEKHSGTGTSVINVRTTGVTTTKTGGANSRLYSVTTPGAAGTATSPQVSGDTSYDFASSEPLVLQPGEGVVVYQEAAGSTSLKVRVMAEWYEQAAVPTSQGEYAFTTAPITGSTAANYTYSSFFNPVASGKSYVVKRIEQRIDRVGATTAPNYISASVRRITAASAGTAVTTTDIPEKNSASATSTADIRTANPTVTLAGTADSRYLGATVPGAVGQDSGLNEQEIIAGEEIVLAPGEGIALYQEAAAGDTNVKVMLRLVWSEVAATTTTTAQASYRVNQQTSASPNNTLVSTWGGTGEDSAASTAMLSDGGYITAGTTTSYGAGQSDILVNRFDNSGNVAWSRTWGGTLDDVAWGIAATSDGGMAVTGYTSSYGSGSQDAVIIKYDSAGTLLWSRTWGGTAADNAYSIVQTPDGGLAITGTTSSYGSEVFLARYDSAGTLLWSRTWGGTSTDYSNSLAVTTDGGFVIGVGTNSFGAGSADAGLVRYDANGNLLWSRVWGGTSFDFANDVAVTQDGGYVLIGTTSSYGVGGGLDDSFIARYDSNGTLQWSRLWGGTGSDEAYSVSITADGGIAVGGYTNSFGASNDNFLLRYDSGGTFLWNRSWGGAGAEAAYTVEATPDGGVAIGGQTASIGNGSNDILMTRYDSAGTIANCSASCATPTATTSTPVPTNSSPAGTNTTVAAGTTTPTPTTTAPVTAATIVTAAVPLTVTAGTALAATNTAATLPGTMFDIRMRISVGMMHANANALTLKLQYAARGADNVCDTSFTNETYADVTTTTTQPISYYDNPTFTSGLPVNTDSKDPTNNSATAVVQTYNESNNFSNSKSAIPAGQDGLFDFSLQSSAAPGATHYCFRVVKSDNSLLNTYSAIPDITTAAVVPPNSPTSLAQTKTTAVDITSGGWTNEMSVRFAASATDPSSSTNLRLCVEKQPLGTGFAGVEDLCGTPVAYTGAAVTPTVTVTGLSNGSQYHWQARLKNTNNWASAWVSYDVNAETARDFGVDTTAPTGGTVYDGTAAGIDGSLNDASLTTLSANWSGIDSTTSGLAGYEYAVGTAAGGSNVKSWTSVATATTMTDSTLTLHTSQMYYVSVRTTDAAGNVSPPISSNGQLVAPTVSFGVSPASLTFGRLNAANAFTNSQTTTLTTSTNAYGGYVIRAYNTDLLRASNNATVGMFNGATYTVPNTWQAGNTGLGYTSSALTVQGVNKFSPTTCAGGGAPPCYVPFTLTAPGDIVADHTGNVSGLPIQNEVFTLTYQVTTPATQAASTYRTATIYTITPIY